MIWDQQRNPRDLQLDIMEQLKRFAPEKANFFDRRFRTLKLLSHRKEPLEKEWTTRNNYPFGSPEIFNHIQKGGNYGFFCPNGDCAFVDADFLEIQTALDKNLPTFWYSTGREGHRQYTLNISNGPIRNIPLTGGAYIKGQKGYAVGPGSLHPNGRIYGLEMSDLTIRTVTVEELLAVLKPFMLRNPESRERPQIRRDEIAWLSLGDLIDISKFRKSGNQYQGPHPIHGSETGVNLSVDLSQNVWHCFRHDSGGSVLEWIAVKEGIIDCAEAIPGALRGEKFWKVLEVAHEKYGLTKETAVEIIKGGRKV
jgi:hypothetical protein